jgi:3-phenylpropionate/trans-cinnamate dioxygenase ferredoxin reductase subunit
MQDAIDYLIVGGGVAGGHAVFEIRKNDKRGTILIVTQEDQFPYDRPPLSKEYLAGKEKKSDVFFRSDSYYSRNKIEVIKRQRVDALDTSNQTVTLSDGRKFSYKNLLLATGGRPRKLDQLPGSELEGIYYLRTLADCDAIRKASSPGKKVAIIGGGFIGCEVAATLRSKRLDVTLVEMTSHLLPSAIDRETADFLKEYHKGKGVNVLLDSTVSKFVGSGRVEGVELRDGTVVHADFVVIGVGIALNSQLAESAGIKTDNGSVVVSEHMETSAPNVYAAGDIAMFYSPLFKLYLRLEHVDVAQKHGAIAGANMASKRKRKKSYDEPPYFFSNQYDLEINAYGDLSRHTTVVRRGEIDAEKGFIQFYFDDKTVSGILSINAKWSDIESAKALVSLDWEYDHTILTDESRTLKAIIKATRKRKKS